MAQIFWKALKEAILFFFCHFSRIHLVGYCNSMEVCQMAFLGVFCEVSKWLYKSRGCNELVTIFKNFGGVWVECDEKKGWMKPYTNEASTINSRKLQNDNFWQLLVMWSLKLSSVAFVFMTFVFLLFMRTGSYSLLTVPVMWWGVLLGCIFCGMVFFQLELSWWSVEQWN